MHPVLKKYNLILYIVVLLAFTGCAWENLPEGEIERELAVKVTMRLGGPMNPNHFYYIVFNLSGNPAKKPYSVFSGLDRAKYWTVYYMWGTPPYRETGLYRGFGSFGASRNRLIDDPPVEEAFITELAEGTVVEGDRMTLVIRLYKLGAALSSINLNMIVCNQAIDGQSRLYYEYEPYVYDSFIERGIEINLKGTDDLWDEVQVENRREHEPNEHELTAPPEADITGWRFQIVTR